VTREDFAAAGWLPWSIVGFDTLGRPDRTLYLRMPRLYEKLFGKGAMSQVTLAGLLASVLVACSPVRSLVFTLGVFLTLVSGLILQVRCVYGGDGAQQMNTILGFSLLIGFNGWISPLAGVVALGFIAAQICLSYSVSGIAKLMSSLWRSGNALPQILSTTAYGSLRAYKFLERHTTLARLLCNATVIVEVLFPVLLISPKGLFLAFLIWGLLFHISLAFLMGLNTFVWSFIATYPALYFVWELAHSALLPKWKLLL